MALRLIQVKLPSEEAQNVPGYLEEENLGSTILDRWVDTMPDGKALVRVLVPQEASEAVMDALQRRFGGVEGFRLLLLPVEATLPRPQEAPPEAAEDKGEEASTVEALVGGRISREELYADVTDMSTLTTIYILMTVLATVVAAIGLVRNNPAVVIGSMVIAPLLGPIVGLALATTLADWRLATSSLRAAGMGALVSVLVATFLGLVFPGAVNPSIPEIAHRTSVGWTDVGLGLAVGGAGVLSFTTGVSTALVGVMVAVALLPPLVVFGLLVGSGHLAEAGGALFLVVTYLVCINLAGIATFVAQGVRPGRWWEADRARRATWLAGVLWAVLLLILLAVLYLNQLGFAV